MEKEIVKIKGVECTLYHVKHNGQWYTIGDNQLGNIIDECIENDQYLTPMVELECGEIIKVITLDEMIAFFLGDLENPTEQDLHNEIEFVYDENPRLN